ncbi:Ribosomal lysine N-methyltransferase set11-like protein [Cladobotryum mycophilum]|uniref:Ribosomal lysine N-methyltransferase set11-like protein n=1 Tax=Cladobotryum mycophilum TaxID=491253 RepID=A0ABR0T3J3_9HYPO
MEAAVEQLLEWTSSQGVVLNGIYPQALPGRGIGIIATRRLESNEVILTVPISMLRTLGNTPKQIIKDLAGATVHAILATSLCLDTSPELERWRPVFPTRHDITSSLPICWPAKLRNLLPARAKALLTAQQDKFNRDWALVSAAYPQIAKDDYLHNWLLVNTRTFYHTSRKTDKLPKEDHMALQPVADLFNHTPEGYCTASFNDKAFTFTTTRAHQPGEEVFIRYGPHANDMLLVEYGFTLPVDTNPWDETCLDQFLCPLFSASQKEHLQDAGFWEKYMLDSQTACYRTQIALRMLCLPLSQWQDVLDGIRDEDEDRKVVDARLAKVLQKYDTHIQDALEELNETTAGEEVIRRHLGERWRQIQQLVSIAKARIQHG